MKFKAIDGDTRLAWGGLAAAMVGVAVVLVSFIWAVSPASSQDPEAAVSVAPRPVVAVLPSGLVALVTTADEAWLRVFDPMTGRPKLAIPLPAGAVRHRSFSPDWSKLSWFDSDGSLVLADLRDNRYVETGRWKPQQVNPRGRRFQGHSFDLATGYLQVGVNDPAVESEITFDLDPRKPGSKWGEHLKRSVYSETDHTGEIADNVDKPVTDNPDLFVQLVATGREIVRARVMTKAIPLPPGTGAAAVYECDVQAGSATTVLCSVIEDRPTPFGAVASLTRDTSTQMISMSQLVPAGGQRIDRMFMSPDRASLLLRRAADWAQASAVSPGQAQHLFDGLQVAPSEKALVLAWV